MKKFVEKPRRVDAFFWDGESESIDRVQDFLQAEKVTTEYVKGLHYLKLGRYTINPGDWIIQSPDGFLARMDDITFRERYQLDEDNKP